MHTILQRTEYTRDPKCNGWRAGRFVIYFWCLLLAIALSSTNAIAHKIPSKGLVAYYPFDNGSTRDLSGHHLDCTPFHVEKTTDRSAHEGKALWFNGIDSVVRCPRATILGVHSGVDMTVSLWVRPKSVGDKNRGIISKYLHFSPEISEFYIDLKGSLDAFDQKILVTGQGFDVFTAERPPLAKWTHIAAVFKGSTGDAELFMDGQLVASGRLTFNPSGSIRPLLIGRVAAPTPTDTEQFYGAIDDVRIYSRALSKDEIAALRAER